MVNFTCLTYAVHKISDEIYSKFYGVDKLIILRVKQGFLKAPPRTMLFRTEALDILLLSEPILICTGKLEYVLFRITINIFKKYMIRCNK